MKPGRPSQTAELVAMARAIAHGRTDVARFADPTALTLLPDGARAVVERIRAGERPPRARDRIGDQLLAKRADMMVARTVAIDDAIRAARAPQVVVLGAGLDGRAWRMPELAEAVVIEVDHPDSQRGKRERAAALTPMAREVRFAAVDFTKDDLGESLAAAGHDAGLPTTWVWEGVVMYLDAAAIDASMRVIAARSAPGSRLVIVYLAPAVMTHLVGLIVRRLGEPFRSRFTPDAMAALLGRHGFDVQGDRDLVTISRSLSPTLARRMRPLRYQRVVVAAPRAGARP